MLYWAWLGCQLHTVQCKALCAAEAHVDYPHHMHIMDWKAVNKVSDSSHRIVTLHILIVSPDHDAGPAPPN